MADTKNDEKNDELPSIDANLYGALAARLSKENPDLAVDVMQSRYYKADAQDPIMALTYLMARQDLEKSPVYQRILIEQGKYVRGLFGSDIKRIADSKLGKDVPSDILTEFVNAYGNVKYGDSRKKLIEYSRKVEALEKARKDARQDLAGLSQEDAKKLIADADKKYQDGIKKLQEEYKQEDLDPAQLVAKMEEATFSGLERDAIMKSRLMPGNKPEDLETIANSDVR